MAVGSWSLETILETKASSILQFLHGLRGELHVTWKKGPGRRGCTICCSRRCSRFWCAIRAAMPYKRRAARATRWMRASWPSCCARECCGPVYHGENGLRTLRELGRSYQTLSKDLNPSEKPSNGDKPLGLASPLQSATSQSGRTNHPSENETGPDVSHHTRISPRAGRSLFS